MAGYKSINIQSGKNKVVLSIICIAIVVLLIVIWSVINKPFNNETKQVKKDLNCFFSGLSKLDKSKVDKYLNYNDLISCFDEIIIKNTKDDNNLEKELFRGLSWNIKKINIDGSTAIVNIEITNKDFKKIIEEWMKKMFEEKKGGKEISEEKALNILNEIICRESQLKKVEKEVFLQKGEKNWKLLIDNNLIDGLFPGLDDIESSINN